MLYEKIETAKSLTLAEYQDLLKLHLTSETTESLDELVCLFVVSAIYTDKDAFDKINQVIQTKMGIELPENQFYYYMCIGLYHYHTYNYIETLESYIKAFEAAHQSNNQLLITEGNRLMALIYRKIGDFEQARYYIERSIRALENVSVPLVNARVYGTYGLILLEMNSFKHSRRVYETSLSYFKQVEGYEKLINYRIILLNLYEICENLQDYESAVKYYLSAHDQKFDTRNVLLNEKFLFSNSMVLKKQGKYLEALEVLESLYDKQKVVRVPGSHNKTDIKMHLGQIETLKSRNETLIKRLTEMYETFNPVDNIVNHYDLEEKLGEALIKGEIKPYFQLLWSVDKQCYYGAEALIRWIKDDIVIPPGQFIADVENTDMIIKLSEKVIHDAFDACRAAIEIGYSDFIVSINITPYQLCHQNLAEFINREMILHNIEGRHVEIEITERSFIEQNPKILEALYQLRDIGIKIALDDFGTGYSSLSCVNDFPIGMIKIDRTLINNISNDEKSYKLLNGIIGMMQALDLEIVAEGVETIEQVELLELLGCNIIQGYYYSKPEPVFSMLESLKLNQKDQ
ncbi:MAG: EAL domain-containing protein [Clostridiales bacterium]|nr:EAL domain-containing protein [Clostridiales bacterium]